MYMRYKFMKRREDKLAPCILFSIDLGKGKLTKKCSRSKITSISLQKAKEIYR